MRLNEFSDQGNFGYDPVNDRLSRAELDDTRKPRLTLRHINKLRKMREAKKLDLKDERQLYQTMYGIPPAAPEEEFDPPVF